MPDSTPENFIFTSISTEPKAPSYLSYWDTSYSYEILVTFLVW